MKYLEFCLYKDNTLNVTSRSCFKATWCWADATKSNALVLTSRPCLIKLEVLTVLKIESSTWNQIASVANLVNLKNFASSFSALWSTKNFLNDFWASLKIWSVCSPLTSALRIYCKMWLIKSIWLQRLLSWFKEISCSVSFSAFSSWRSWAFSYVYC